MKKIVLGIFLLVLTFGSQAQEKEAVIKTIDDFFVAFEAKDTSSLDKLMHNQCMLFSTMFDKDGNIKNEVVSKASMMGFMKRAIEKKITFDERLWSYHVAIEDNMATVWTEYTLYVGENLDQVSHCGTNVFSLIRTPEKNWVITNVTDTRRKTNCKEEAITAESQKVILNKFMDDWHKAAATADEDAFFGAMTEDGIYMGTDATEYWKRDELKKWSKFAFDRDVAWAFTPSERNIYFSDDMQMAWFDESLDTWMGECRGSGVLKLVNGEWKLKHYNLAVTIPNDLVNCFIHLVEKGKCNKKRKK